MRFDKGSNVSKPTNEKASIKTLGTNNLQPNVPSIPAYIIKDDRKDLIRDRGEASNKKFNTIKEKISYSVNGKYRAEKEL